MAVYLEVKNEGNLFKVDQTKFDPTLLGQLEWYRDEDEDIIITGVPSHIEYTHDEIGRIEFYEE